MAHFTLIHNGTGGVWNDGDVPGGSAFTQIDQNLAKAINGDDGGVWTPTSAIQLGGAGVQMSGAGYVSARTVTGADADTTYHVSDADAILIPSTLTANRTYTLAVTDTPRDGSVITIWIKLSAQPSFTVTVKDQSGNTLVTMGPGSSTSAYPWCSFICVGSAWSLFQEGPNFRSGANAFSVPAGSVCTMSGQIQLSGAGYVAVRAINGADSNTTYQISNADWIQVTGGITADRVYSLGVADSPHDGATILFTAKSDLSHTIQINDDQGNILAYLGNSAQQRQSLLVRVIGGHWYAAQYGPNFNAGIDGLTIPSGKTLDVKGTTTLEGTVTRGTSSAAFPERYVFGGNADTTFYPTQVDVIVFNGSSLTATRNYSLDSVTAVAGCRVRVCGLYGALNAGTNLINVLNGVGGATIISLKYNNTSGDPWSAEFLYTTQNGWIMTGLWRI